MIFRDNSFVSAPHKWTKNSINSASNDNEKFPGVKMDLYPDKWKKPPKGTRSPISPYCYQQLPNIYKGGIKTERQKAQVFNSFEGKLDVGLAEMNEHSGSDYNLHNAKSKSRIYRQLSALGNQFESILAKVSPIDKNHRSIKPRQSESPRFDDKIHSTLNNKNLYEHQLRSCYGPEIGLGGVKKVEKVNKSTPELK